MSPQKERILLAMSGGVDSTAAVLLLQEQGYELVGCTFRTRYTHDASLLAASRLAEQLGIAHHVVDYAECFDETVIRYFCDEYAAGRTPNPCVLCNRVIKFGALLDEADRLGCDKIATGHYARVDNGQLYRAKDTHKDQTYFLWQVSPEQLARAVFPLGNMLKKDVREYLAQKGYTDLAHQGESQDICFIEQDYRTFLNAHLPINNLSPITYQLTNNLSPITNNHSLITANLAPITNYTIGQRKGLGVALGVPAFVTAIDATANTVTLGTHDDLYTREITLRDWVFIGNAAQPVMAQIRYRSCPSEAMWDAKKGLVTFTNPVWAATPGQSCVFYQGDALVGGGIIC